MRSHLIRRLLALAAVALLVVLVVFISFKEWKLYLFDPSFARGLGISGRWMDAVYTAVLVLVIVTGIQAVGVILMAAMLIIPAVSARYWTHSFGAMTLLSALFGGASGAVGTLISTWGKGWPTGPFIVLAAASLFLVSLFFGSAKGVVVQYAQRKAHQRRLRRSVAGKGVLEKGGLT